MGKEDFDGQYKVPTADEKSAQREELANLTELALSLAQDRCELAMQAGELNKQIVTLSEAMDKIGKELMVLGGQEMQVHAKRKQLARFLISDGLTDMDVR